MSGAGRSGRLHVRTGARRGRRICGADQRGRLHVCATRRDGRALWRDRGTGVRRDPTFGACEEDVGKWVARLSHWSGTLGRRGQAPGLSRIGQANPAPGPRPATSASTKAHVTAGYRGEPLWSEGGWPLRRFQDKPDSSMAGRAAAHRRAAAFFDLDRTLISGSSAFAFGVAAWRNDLLPTGQLLRDAADAAAFRVAGSTDERSEAIRDRILAYVAGHRVEDLARLGDDVVPEVLARVRPEAKGLLDMHAEAGRDRLIVSATPQELTDRLAGALGLEGSVGTRSEIVDGRYTGQLEGPFVYGRGKAEAIEKLAAARGYDLALSYAYGDSSSDLPMLELVGHPVAVNPDRSLAAVAHQRGWPVVVFARTAKRVIGTTTATGAAAAVATATYALGRRHGRIAAEARWAGLRRLRR
jgi:HAD superfamily hydrolase (TIGR01490 family)